ncbi:MAG: ThuA domain-containing protein [Halieaceae bacterium]|nr:ThuA domain-containing protein [Halieaceae bacterium]
MFKKIMVGLLLAAAVTAFIGVYFLYSTGLLREPHYDNQAPIIPELKSPAVLVLSKTNGFVHTEAIPAAGAMLAELAVQNGWHIYQSENAASHNAQDLARFDVVVWNNTSGDILTPTQREDFKVWLLGGGKWLGIHAAGGDPSYAWNWYVDNLLGAQFICHTMAPQFQDANVLVVDHEEPLTMHLPSSWHVLQEEWYGFDRNPRQSGARILLAMDESSYDTEPLLFPDSTMEGEHPIAWARSLGKGEIIYSAIGHTAQTYALPEYQRFIAGAINKLAGQRP